MIGIVVVAALVGVTIASNRVLSQREAARELELAAHPWILPTLEGPVHQVWQVEGPGLVAEGEGVVVIGDLLGSGELRALDTATGDELWSRVRPGEVCRGVQEGPDDVGPPSEAANLDPDYLLCMPVGNYLRDHRPPAPGLVTTIAVLHPTRGEELSTVEVAGTPLTWDVVGSGDVLVTFVTHEAAVGIVRWDVGARLLVWSFESEPGVMPQGLYGEWQHLVHDGVVRVTTEDVAFAVSVETGEAVSPDDAAPVTDPERVRASLPDGGAVEWVDDRGVDGVGRVLAPDGSTRFEFDGIPWLAWRSDGSVPEILVVQRPDSGGLAGLDAATGEQRWTLATPQRPTPVLQIEGTVIATAGERATAIDLRRGTSLWEAAIATTVGPAAVTDGEVVILPVRNGWESSLVALQVRSGLELWRSPVRPGVQELHATPDGTVLLLSPSGITAYR